MKMETSYCIKCCSETTLEFDLVTIKTMEDYGFRKTHYYQAMGDILTASVCESCVKEYIQNELNPRKKNILKITYTILMTLISLAILVIIEFLPLTIFLIILNVVIIAGCVQEFNKRKVRIEKIKARSKDQNKRIMAVELIASNLPKKRNDARLTYIELERILGDNLAELGREYGVSQSKLLKIRHYLKQEGKEEAIRRQEEINEQAANLDIKAVKKELRRLRKKRKL